MIDIICYVREGAAICICLKTVARNTKVYMKVIIFTLPTRTLQFII